MQADHDKIQKLMMDRGLNNKQMAENAGMKEPAMCRLVAKARDGVSIQPDSIFKIAKGLGVEPAAIRSDEVEAKKC